MSNLMKNINLKPGACMHFIVPVPKGGNKSAQIDLHNVQGCSWRAILMQIKPHPVLPKAGMACGFHQWKDHSDDIPTIN